MNRKILLLFIFFLPFMATAQDHSVARQWNDVLLEAIRNDFARPTVHARNLFHSSMMMYDIWAAYDDRAETVFLGKTVGGYTCPYDGVARDGNVAAFRDEAINYAMYTLLRHRFRNSPGAEESLPLIEALFEAQGHDKSFISTDYSTGNAAAFGNYIAENMIAFGLQDGANEEYDYTNNYYRNWNFPLAPELKTNPFLWDPNRWQPLTFEVFIDQSGNEIPGGAPEFLSPEWGLVTPFAMGPEQLNIYQKEGSDWWVYYDPGKPPHIDTQNGGVETDQYKWGFSLVALWSSQLDPNDGVMWDISPASIGNIDLADFPTNFADYPDFYDSFNGGDISKGHAVNPKTGQPYEPQLVPRADYARVLAEFWADGPDSETPPGHWFSLLNYVNDHPAFEKRFKGKGEILADLEWDVKSYLMMGGAVHDAAIAAWGIKGYYDYLRPISAIRYMAEQGQSTDPNLPNYSIAGIPLQEGFIEQIQAGDPLAGDNNEFVGQIKIYAWRGPDFIDDEAKEFAGVDWIPANQWWPYQRPTFVTPPFAGFVSGHSTFSRAAAEVMTLLTGDEFFPGGMGEFLAKENEFLVFEEGPSQDVVLQWATYRDASDQTSLSRIWGGIHPPADDIPGRIIGEKIGIQAFNYAEKYFNNIASSVDNNIADEPTKLYPNPVKNGALIVVEGAFKNAEVLVELFDYTGKLVDLKTIASFSNRLEVGFSKIDLANGFYQLKITGKEINLGYKIQVY